MIEGFRKALGFPRDDLEQMALLPGEDRKSTRLNSSHSQISYAVFCLKKQTNVAAAHLDLHRHRDAGDADGVVGIRAHVPGEWGIYHSFSQRVFGAERAVGVLEVDDQA